MATKKVSKKEIDLVVPEFVSTFGTSLKPKAKEDASSKKEKAKQDSSFQHESNASIANRGTSSPASPQLNDAAQKQPTSSPTAAFNSMQTLPSSPVKQALAKAQQSFGAKSADQSKEKASAAAKVIDVPEFVSTCASSFVPQ